MKKRRAASAAAILTLASAAPLMGAHAQPRIVDAPGAPLSGICTYSAQVVLGTSLAGVAANQRLASLSQQQASQLQPMGTQLDADGKALTAQKATLAAAVYQQKLNALQQRAQDLRALAQTRNTQLERTRDIAVGQISAATVPLLNAAIAAHRCSIVVDKGATYTVNPAMDITPEITQKLNTAMPTISFDLAPPPPAK
jgi:Skp family chaperone for outer membrane proteins